MRLGGQSDWVEVDTSDGIVLVVGNSYESNTYELSAPEAQRLATVLLTAAEHPVSACACGQRPDPGVCSGCPVNSGSHCVCSHP